MGARPEVTGRRRGSATAKADRGSREDPTLDDEFKSQPLPAAAPASLRSQHRARRPPEGGDDAYTILEFCARHKISEAFYYKLRAQSLGPRELRLGTRVIITKSAAADWRIAHEARTQASTTAA
jgi:hypothetical protein